MIIFVVTVKMIHHETLTIIKHKIEFDTFDEAQEFLKKERFNFEYDLHIKIKKVHK
jgi:hypothetical protein